MAEFVQSHLESMSEEFNELITIKLYTKDEIKCIIKKRTQFEYKLNGPTKILKDYKDYIEYEKLLIKQIRLRRTQHRIQNNKHSIEYRILRRIRRIYETAVERYSNDFELYIAYFKFCKETSFIKGASEAMTHLLENFAHQPEVFLLASCWYKQHKDANTALKVINKGLVLHKRSIKLYAEVLDLELGHLALTCPEKTILEQEDIDKLHKKIYVYVETFFDNINAYKHYLELLIVLEKYNYTDEIQNKIIDKLTKNYDNCEEVWHFLAQRKLRLSQAKKLPYSDCLDLCVKEYEEGLLRVSQQNRKKLWALYIEFLERIWQECDKLKDMKLNLLKSSYERASKESCLDTKSYLMWADFVNDNEALNILEEATKQIPNSTYLWEFQLQYAIKLDNIRKINETFMSGARALKENALSLWKMAICYHSLASKTHIVNSIYLDAIKQPDEISNEFKPKYLEWLLIMKGIDEVRRIYNEVANKKPYCKEMHFIMLKIESYQTDFTFERGKKYLENACEQFGKESIDVWIKYIEFHLEQDNIDNESIQIIYQRAEKSLLLFLVQDFKESYRLTMKNA